METMERISKLSKIERNVFFEELEDMGHEEDFIRCAAALSDVELNRILEPFHPYYQKEILAEIHRVRPVAAAEVSAVGSCPDENSRKHERPHGATGEVTIRQCSPDPDKPRFHEGVVDTLQTFERPVDGTALPAGGKTIGQRRNDCQTP